jgi:AraC family transcriptional regulator, regulatory protein of adaptative response / DNA-3-methyladenine glycosylase II
MQTRDARFDGRFFIGVTSTKIYCRPVCRVRLPLQKNCTFHASAAAAELLGFRPCLKCRPELAPGRTSGFAETEASATLAHAAARLIEAGMSEGWKLDRVADRVGVTTRHLRRIFQAEFGASPIAYLQTQRLLFAKRLLTDTKLPVTQVALASGFQSLRRMNTLFLERYRFSPSQLRKRVPLGAEAAYFRFVLPYRPPYDWTGLLRFLEQRSIPGVETLSDGVYRRTLRVVHLEEEHLGWVQISPLPKLANGRRDAMLVHIAPSMAAVLPQTLERVKRLLDIDADPQTIAEGLGDLAQAHVGLRLPAAMDSFELAVRAIIGQQVTVAAARTVATRLARTFGTAVDAYQGLTLVFPTPEKLAACLPGDIAKLGMPEARARTIVLLAQAASSGDLDLSFRAEAESTVRKLQNIVGIGPWTASYIAMRALSAPDIWLPKDVALLHALGLPNNAKGHREAEARAKAWSPWRSYAVLHLWRKMEKKAQ